MPEANELANTPIEVQFGKKKLKLRRLCLEDVFATMESLVLSERIERIHKVAASLQDSERLEYLRGATSDLPEGADLQERSQSKLSTISGLRNVVLMAAKTDQPELTVDDVKGMLDIENLEKFSSLVSFLCGVEVDLDSLDLEDGSSEKKTESVTHVKS